MKYIDGNNGVLEISESSIVFTPPLYRQRYLRVKEKIESYSHGTLSKVLDMGCSDLKFFRYLRDIPGIQEIILLDKDETILKDNFHHVKPMVGDYIMLRTEPLLVRAICGDATIYNPVMKGIQVVTMIELIEHMYPSELPLLVDNVFKKLRPKLVIITTPNSDFNQYIPDFVPGTFRHWDHKFEWTGEQFNKWCYGIIQDAVDYAVEISGCGLGPNSTYCSQMAIFVQSAKNTEESLTMSLSNVNFNAMTNNTFDPCDKTKILFEFSYPLDSRSEEEKDQHFTLHKFHTLLSFLRLEEDSPNSYMDQQVDEGYDEIKEAVANRSDQCEWSPKNQSGIAIIEVPPCIKSTKPIKFQICHVTKESEIPWNNGSEDHIVYPIVNYKYAVLTHASLSAWVNNDSDKNIPSDLIRSTVEAECFDCTGDGDKWKVKTTLWEDSDSSDYEGRKEDERGENAAVWLEEDLTCDLWDDVVDSTAAVIKQGQQDSEVDRGWGESDESDWDS